MRKLFLVLLFLLSIWIKGQSQFINYQFNYDGGAEATIDGTSEVSYISIPSSTTLKNISGRVYSPHEFYSSGQNIQTAYYVDLYSTSANVDITTNTDTYGNDYFELSLNTPITGGPDLIINQYYEAETEVVLSGFTSLHPFPTNYSSEYTQPTTNIQSNDPDIVNTANSICNGCTTMQEAVQKITQWVIGNLSYYSTGSNDIQNASMVFDRKTGNCAGYTNLTIALLRSVSIPARFVSGVKLDNEFYLPIYGGGTIKWGTGEGAHAICEVYYPDKGWVAFDPQRSLNFESTHFVRLTHGPDDCDVLATISCSYSGSEPTLHLTEMCGEITSFTNNYSYQNYETYSAPNSNKYIFSLGAGLTTGIGDHIEIANGSFDFKTGESLYFSSSFTSESGNTYPIEYNWYIKLFYDGGTYIYKTENSTLGSSINFITDPLIPNYPWLMDSNGNIYGEVSIIALLNDGDWVGDKLPVSVEECQGLYISNQTYTSATTLQGCYITLNNISVSNNKLTLNSEMGSTIEKDFNVGLGAEFEIQ